MELKKIVGLVVLCIVLFLLFTAGGKNDYKHKSSWFPNCIPIPFFNHEICFKKKTKKRNRPRRSRRRQHELR